MTFTDEQKIMRAFPSIPWKEPVNIEVPGVGEGMCCRICIAVHGLRGTNLPERGMTRDEFDRHLFEEHHIP